MKVQHPHKALCLPQTKFTSKPQEVQVTYLILSFSKRLLPPILMPCLYTPVKNGNRIKRFFSFPDTLAATNAPYFNETQQLLNTICLAMLKETEQLHPSREEYEPAWQWQQYKPIFKLWQKCWPLLYTQPNICYSHLYQPEYLGKKPKLKEITPIIVSPDKVHPHFLLKTYPGHYRLLMGIPHQDKQLHSEAGILPFFVHCPETDCFYLLPTLAIAKLLSQMHDAVPYLSIFKPQYKSFQKQILTALQKQGLIHISVAKKKSQ